VSWTPTSRCAGSRIDGFCSFLKGRAIEFALFLKDGRSPARSYITVGAIADALCAVLCAQALASISRGPAMPYLLMFVGLVDPDKVCRAMRCVCLDPRRCAQCTAAALQPLHVCGYDRLELAAWRLLSRRGPSEAHTHTQADIGERRSARAFCAGAQAGRAGLRRWRAGGESRAPSAGCPPSRLHMVLRVRVEIMGSQNSES
jgi:hypothetical protein